MNTFLGIYREPACSPGRHRENDAAVLELVASELEARGHRVALADVDAAPRAGHEADVVFSMSRSPVALDLLARWRHDGKLVVNRPAAVIETARARLALRSFATVAQPATRLVPTSPALRRHIGTIAPEGRWVKGGDLYASRREDVQRVESAERFEQVLDDFDRRGITTAILQEHVEGREIKFYAVGGDGFFHWLETRQPDSSPELNAAGFQRRTVDAGRGLGLDIFGGDIILRADGSVVLIDLNDWPSFAPCLQEGAAGIAALLDARYLARYAAAPLAGSGTPSPSV
jgi:hypothetical protein